jgi:phage FluMu protein Com
MAIEFRCGSCEKLLRVPDDAAGQEAKCPNCAAVLTVPAASAPPESPSPFGPLPSQSAGADDHNPYAQPPTERTGEVNPYASPTSDTGIEFSIPTGGATDIVPTVMDIGEVLNRTWAIYKANFWMCVGVVAVALVLSQAASQVTNIVVMPLQAAGADIVVVMIANFVCTVVATVFNFWIALGQTLFLIQLARGNNPEFMLLFQGGRFLLRFLGYYILLMLMGAGILGVAAVAALIAYLATNDEQVTLIAGLVVGVPALVVWMYVFLMLSQAGNLIVDRDMGVIDSMSVSKSITQGNKLLLFVLGILFMLLMFAGLLACCFGIFATAPFAYLMLAVAYLVMCGQQTLYQPATAF